MCDFCTDITTTIFRNSIVHNEHNNYEKYEKYGDHHDNCDTYYDAYCGNCNRHIFETLVMLGSINSVKYYLNYCKTKHITLTNTIYHDVFKKSCTHGMINIAKLLYDFCVENDMRIKIGNNDDIAINSCMMNRLEIIDYLYDLSKIDNNIVFNIHQNDEHMFRHSCRLGNIRMMNKLYMLAKNDNDPIDVFSLNWNAFTYACENNKPNTLIWFIENMIDDIKAQFTNIFDIVMNNLIVASKNGFFDVVVAILKLFQSSDPNAFVIMIDNDHYNILPIICKKYNDHINYARKKNEKYLKSLFDIFILFVELFKCYDYKINDDYSMTIIKKSLKTYLIENIDNCERLDAICVTFNDKFFDVYGAFDECEICYEHMDYITIFECKHCMCYKCYIKVTSCHKCRKYIIDDKTIFVKPKRNDMNT
jgi:hypothetical protein